MTSEQTVPGAAPGTARSVASPQTLQPPGPLAATPPEAPVDGALGAPGTVVTPVPPGRQVVSVRRARVAVTRVDPWSVMKLSFVLSLALVVIFMVAAALLWWVLNGSGVFDQLNTTLQSVTGTSNLRLQDVASLGRVMGIGGLIGLIDVVLLTALATLAAFLFNLTTGLVGGIDVVLTESD
jgi:Transmembrane domain of unknown function (DUF3566)